MAIFNKHESKITCKKEDISFNFINVPKNDFDYFTIIDTAELSVYNVKNVTKSIKDKYSHNPVTILIEDTFEGVDTIHLRTNYIGEGANGVFKGKIAEYSENSQLGQLILKEYKLHLENQ